MDDIGTITIYQYIQNILIQDFQPILHAVVSFGYMIGLMLFVTALMRLQRHGHGSFMHRISPMGTLMYFVASVLLILSIPFLQIFSNSLFNIDTQSALMQQCIVASPASGASSASWLPIMPANSTSSFYTSSNSFCPMLAYDIRINTYAEQNQLGQAIEALMFGLMFLIGVISFIRGVVLLTKIGEGGGQGQTVGRAMTFIFAGIVGVNMDAIYTLVQNMLTLNAGGS